MEDVWLVDLSAIQLKSVSYLVREDLLRGRLIIHRVILMEIEEQASQGDTLAIRGLEELEKACRSCNVEIIYAGSFGGSVENDRLSIIDEAKKLDASLITCDPTTAKLAESIGIRAVSYTHLTLPTNREV